MRDLEDTQWVIEHQYHPDTPLDPTNPRLADALIEVAWKIRTFTAVKVPDEVSIQTFDGRIVRTDAWQATNGYSNGYSGMFVWGADG